MMRPIQEERRHYWGYWGVRLLVGILALTASRANFPISEWARSLSAPQCSAQVAVTHQPLKKSEGVTPSRRNVETRKSDWLRKTDAEPLPQAAAFDRSTDLQTLPSALQPPALTDRRSPVTRQDPQQRFLLSSRVSALPPPA
jgi:hypothetical protein